MESIPNISELLDKYLLEKNKVEGDRPVAGGATWRASKLGSCLKAQYLEFHLKQPKIVEMDALSLRRFEVGHQWGRQFKDWFLKMGFVFEEEATLYDKNLDIGGHADFILMHPQMVKMKVGIELKSVNSQWFWYRAREAGSKKPMYGERADGSVFMNRPPLDAKTTASPEHMMQAAVYSLLTEEAYPWIVLTVSKDDLTMQQDVVTEAHRAEARSRLTVLNTAKAIGRPPSCTCKDNWHWQYCDYFSNPEARREWLRLTPNQRKKTPIPDGACCEIK